MRAKDKKVGGKDMMGKMFGPGARILGALGQLVIMMVITSLQYVAGGAVLAALLVALARPLWGTVTETVEQEGVPYTFVTHLEVEVDELALHLPLEDRPGLVAGRLEVAVQNEAFVDGHGLEDGGADGRGQTVIIRRHPTCGRA